MLDCLLDKTAASGYLRLVSVPCEIPYEIPQGYRPRRGVGVELRAGKDAVIIGYGPVLLPQAWRAAELLHERYGREVAVVNLPWLNRVDPDWLAGTIAGCEAVFTLDNHLVNGGQGIRVAAAVAALGLAQSPRVHHFGLRDFPLCGQNNEVLRAHGLDAESMADEIVRVLDKRVLQADIA